MDSQSPFSFSEGNLSDFLTPRNFAERAEPLVKLGIPIIPLAPRSKEPITINGVKAASLDPAIIEAWSKVPGKEVSRPLQRRGLRSL